MLYTDVVGCVFSNRMFPKWYIMVLDEYHIFELIDNPKNDFSYQVSRQHIDSDEWNKL